MTDADDRFQRPTERPPRDTTPPATVRLASYAATATYYITDQNGRHCERDRIDTTDPQELHAAVETLQQRHAHKTGLEIVTEKIEPNGRSHRLTADHQHDHATSLQRIRELKETLHNRKHHTTATTTIDQDEIF